MSQPSQYRRTRISISKSILEPISCLLSTACVLVDRYALKPHMLSLIDKEKGFYPYPNVCRVAPVQSRLWHTLVVDRLTWYRMLCLACDALINAGKASRSCRPSYNYRMVRLCRVRVLFDTGLYRTAFALVLVKCHQGYVSALQEELETVLWSVHCHRRRWWSATQSDGATRPQ